MEKGDINIISELWSTYFPKDLFNTNDKRLKSISYFINFFLGFKSEGRFKTDSSSIINLNVCELRQLLNEIDDFVQALITRPHEVTGSIGLALSVICSRNTKLQRITPRFYNLPVETTFMELKSSTVGQLVCLRGYVIRVTNCRPLVLGAAFWCSKCQQEMFVHFDDGLFVPPNSCPTKK